MPVTPERRAFITRETAIDVQKDETILARHLGARQTLDADGKPGPRLAYWDSLADAAAINLEAFNLLKVERRRFAVVIPEVLSFTGDLDYTQATPTVTLVDEEHRVAADFLIARIEIDLDAETTTLEVFG